MSSTLILIALIALVAIVAVLQVVLLARPRHDETMAQKLDVLRGDSERIERVLREEQRAGRTELADTLTRMGDQMRLSLSSLTADNQQRLGEVRTTLDAQLKALQTDNAAQLEKMRATVDEKLQATLEARLSSSFKQIAERLEAVQRGLGEMQSLATGVGDLKRVLSNVKTRGTFGEVRLGALLEAGADTGAVRRERRHGPRLGRARRIRDPPSGIRPRRPGLAADRRQVPASRTTSVCWMRRSRPMARQPTLPPQRLQRRVEGEARTIREKYVASPHTTDFALLFLPTEGLYAEVIRRPGLFEKLQREHHVTVAGPTTLAAILNALQMGFRTLAIEHRSSEVWQILGAVKTEFGKFGDVLDKVKKKLDEAGKHIDATGVRTRAIERRLRGVESLPGEDAQALMAPRTEDDDDVNENSETD